MKPNHIFFIIDKNKEFGKGIITIMKKLCENSLQKKVE